MITSGGKSQGYYANYERYKQSQVVIINLKIGTKYETDNIIDWSQRNFPELINKKGYSKYINELLNKKIKLHNKTWWACYKEDWKGYIDIDLNNQMYKKFITSDKDNNEITIEDATLFCKTNKINISGFYAMLKGDRKHHLSYKLIKNRVYI